MNNSGAQRDCCRGARSEFPLGVFRTEVSFRELTRAAHQEILLPTRRHGQESTMQTITHALIETRRDRTFVRSELGPLLALPDRPRNALLTTFGVSLDAHFNVTAASRVLSIRWQTIHYRLDQFTGLLGSLDDLSRKLDFLVAFALLRCGTSRPSTQAANGDTKSLFAGN
jgi:DNA-binding PucR family transcriptional regulator